MDVGGWLRGLGLGQYETNFRDNKINADLLPRLTNDDLKDIGVSALGDRLQLLDAIAALAGAKPTADAPASQSGPPPPKGPAFSAERRPITVMFCDLVGSTSMAAKLDAEDWRTLVNSYLDEASAAVTGLGGHVLKKLGDGLMALFGYPHAQENDAERAVRAALAIQRALVEINARNASRGAPELSARIGLDSGQVVVDATGEVFGDAPNIAARVQGAAAPGSILITAAVQRQTAGLFVAEERGQHELKGVSAPMTLYRVVRASGGGRRGGARALTPLVGREEELDLLTRRWERAHKGEGQLTLIVGEPGLGKSRLMDEFHGRLGETPHTWVEWSSSQLLQNTPLHPIAEWGRQRFGADLPAEQRLADFENTLELVGLDPTEYAPLLAPLVDVLLPEDRAAKLAPEELRRRQLAAMTAWILAAAKTQAVVLAFEDLHWADPTSLDLMRALAERGAQAPLLVIATARPEFRPPWSVRSHHSAISLSPLDSAQIAKMVRELSSRHALPKDIVEGVSERTGGVPLFVEEVTRLLLERGEQGGAQAIPPTLQQSLAARLDRLGSARETAQIGAVLGRGFSYALLRSVAGLDEGSLRSALERLAEADILFVEGDGAQATYRFKHALIQDAAYDSLLKSRRQALHAQAAEILRESGSPEPEAIAHHFTQAGLDDLAIEWWGKAGDQALRRSAFQEAIAHLSKAIAMADKAAGGKAAGKRLHLQTAYGNAMILARGYGAPETSAVFERARDIATGVEDVPERLSAQYGLWVGSFTRGELGAARELSAAMLRDCAGRPQSGEAGVAHRIAGATHWFAGEFVAARDHLEQALAIFDAERDRDLAFRFGQDAGVAALAFSALALWPLGEVGLAEERMKQLIARATKSGHAGTAAYGLFHAAELELTRWNADGAAPLARSLIEIANEHQSATWMTYSVWFVGWLEWRLGNRDTGLSGMRDGWARLVEAGWVYPVSLYETILAEAEAEAGETDAALATIDRAIAESERTGQRWYEAESHRIRGEILLKHNPCNPAPAEEAFLASIAIAQTQKARSFELRAALLLAKLYQSTARPAEAHAILAPALEGFAPTKEMPEIAEAETLLAALAETDDVKVEAARRESRFRVQVAYGNALQSARGYGAPETVHAFARARDLSDSSEDLLAKIATLYGVWLGAVTKGGFEPGREAAEAMLAEATRMGDPAATGVAHRALGATLLYGGGFEEAKRHLDSAVALLEPVSNPELAQRSNGSPLAAARILRALAAWATLDPDRADSEASHAIAEAERIGDAASLSYYYGWKAIIEAERRNVEQAGEDARRVLAIAADKGLRSWVAVATLLDKWSRSPLGGGAFSAAMVHEARAGLAEVGHDAILGPVFATLAAEWAARAGRADEGLALVDAMLADIRRNGVRWHEAELRRVRGEALTLGIAADPTGAEAEFKAAIIIARDQGARSFELRASMSLAKFYQSMGRLTEAHAILAPALEGFAPTLEMPEIAEAQALLAALTETDEVKAAAAQRQRRLHLQTAYGNALIAARGYGAPETTEAFARARESAFGDKDAPGRLAADYGLWVGSFTRGELPEMRAHAAAFLSDLEATPESPEAGVAHRAAGATCWFAGEYAQARDHLERALALFRPGRDDDMAFRFGQDPGVSAMGYLALVLWPPGEIDRAASLNSRMLARIGSLTHGNTIALGHTFAAQFALMRGDPIRGKVSSLELARIASAHDLPDFRAFGMFFDGWTRVESDLLGGLVGMRRGVDSLRAQNTWIFDGLVKIALAKTEAEAGDPGHAVAILDEALTTADRVGHRTFDAELYRVRGEMLLKGDPANPAPAEEAFLTAIAVSRQQGARSFELRAALSLAKLYQSTARPTDAHAALAPALEGFAPTLEMPEIAEAQALLTALAATDEVKAEAARRQRLTPLHVAYGNALIAARGYGAPETAEAFARARESASGNKDTPERLASDYGLWVGSYARGDLPSMRAHAAAFLNDAAARPDSPEAGVAHRAFGTTCWFAGDYREARDHFERALPLFQPGRDDGLAFRFGQDQGVVAMANLAFALWPLGEVDRAISLIDRMQARVVDLTHVGSLAFGAAFAALFELMRGDHARAAPNALELARLAREYDLPMWRAYAVFLDGLVKAESGAPVEGLSDMRRGVELLREQNVLTFDGLLKMALAETEARTGDPDRAVAILDEALATCNRTGYRAFEAELHRARSEMLLRRDPANSAPAEEAFLTAIAVAKKQGTRSFELRAALSLAKLYQSTAHPVDAHAVLAPALDGFAPTLEMPEIAEAQALLSRRA